MNRDKLQECPFCGKDSADLEDNDGSYSVYCLSCCARIGTYRTEKYAIEAWNSRHPTSAMHSDGECRCTKCGTILDDGKCWDCIGDGGSRTD